MNLNTEKNISYNLFLPTTMAPYLMYFWIESNDSLPQLQNTKNRKVKVAPCDVRVRAHPARDFLSRL